ncbi:MAG: NYN domain-containing protein [Clostridia bacterium]|nr:NYN domain-containing protein [Clostridia bacterium]
MEKTTIGVQCDHASEFTDYRDNTYDIVSTVAYLSGIRKSIFENEHISLDIQYYKKLENDKNARIVRHLCIVRTYIMRNFGKINHAFKTELCSIRSLPEFIPDESMMQLAADRVDFVKKTSVVLSNHLVEINRLIKDRVNNCRSLFPIWINWDYIAKLFIMPDGLNDNAVMQSIELYRSNFSLYPYQMYINWKPEDCGNILNSDKKFLTLLYKWNNDRFAAHSMVSNASEFVKTNIYNFIGESGKTVLVVDCENSDPFSLCAVFKNMEQEYLNKISGIILFDDVHASTAWELLGRYAGVEVEHLTIERLKSNKSLVDQSLIARVFREHYTNQVDSFVIVSSDSDYWALISNLPEAKFLVMLERAKCSAALRQALVEHRIFYCYIDDFNGGSGDEIKLAALFAQMRSYVEKAIHMNVNTMLDEAIRSTRVTMLPDEKSRFYEKYIKNMKFVITENGDVKVEFGRK